MKSEDFKNAIQKFCNNYNQENLPALPLFTILSENKIAAIIPNDTDLGIYCYFVNNTYYPNNVFSNQLLKLGHQQNKLKIG